VLTVAEPDVGNPAREDRTRQAATYWLFWPWVVLTVACLGLMWAAPGEEVVPFHLIWIGFALAYGFEPWPVPITCVALALATVLSGAILLTRASLGIIAWEETSEILLMATLACLVLWHVRRRLAATAAVTRLADHQVAAARQRERLGRLTSHEMRTPLTIASGYVDLLLAHEDRHDQCDDLLVVRDELGRLVRAGDRLLRTITLEDELPQDSLDLSDLVEETVTRWSTVAHRTWVSDTTQATGVASRERLRVCLDTLIENAVRYTEPGGTIRVFCHPDGPGAICLGVADSGPGFSPEQAALLNDRECAAHGDNGLGIGPSGPGGQTGYGLGIVQEIITARHGTVRAERAPEGGALVRMHLPDGLGGAASGRRPSDRS
jgi:signal transduction histidine kinase